LDDPLLAFVAVSIAVVVIPGPDMALVARNVLRHGRSAGFATSVGICTGVLGWAIAAARLAWLLIYSAMLGALGTALGRPGPRRLMRWLTGTILVGLGARVALERG
jgi:threonine/homoserine/homoserine lactone efflux protein